MFWMFWLVYVTESFGGECRIHLEIVPAKLSKLILIAWCFTKPRVCLRPTKPNQATQSIVNKRAQIHCCPMLGNLQRKIFFRAGSTGGRNTCQVKLHLLSSLSEVTVKSNKLSRPLQFSEKVGVLSQPASSPRSVGKGGFQFPLLFCIIECKTFLLKKHHMSHGYCWFHSLAVTVSH